MVELMNFFSCKIHWQRINSQQRYALTDQHCFIWITLTMWFQARSLSYGTRRHKFQCCDQTTIKVLILECVRMRVLVYNRNEPRSSIPVVWTVHDICAQKSTQQCFHTCACMRIWSKKRMERCYMRLLEWKENQLFVSFLLCVKKEEKRCLCVCVGNMKQNMYVLESYVVV